METIIAAPVFYGQGSTNKEHLTAEAFIHRYEAHGKKQNWTELQLTENFVASLRGDADDWFRGGRITFNETRTEKKRILATYTNGIKPKFVLKYGEVNQAGDLSSAWTKMSQKNSENPSRFADRVVSVLGRTAKVIRAPAIEDPKLILSDQELVAYNAADAPLLAIFLKLLKEVEAAAREVQSQAIIDTLTTSMVISGLKNKTTAHTLNLMAVEGKSPKEILDKLESLCQTEQSNGAKPRPEVMAMEASDNDDDSNDSINKIDKEKQKKWKEAQKKKNKAAPTAAKSTPSNAAQKPTYFNGHLIRNPNVTCHTCKQTGHPQSLCPQKTKIEELLRQDQLRQDRISELHRLEDNANNDDNNNFARY